MLSNNPGSGGRGTAQHAFDPPLLRLTKVNAGYGKRAVLHDIDIDVARGEILAILGHNGAGKTTLLRTVLGLVATTSGNIQLGDKVLGPGTASRADAADTMAMIPSERFVFGDMTITENLQLGGRKADAGEYAERLSQVEEMFPLLRDRRTQLAGTLSGGQQRMVSLAMALLSAPSILLLDEPSLGLAPNLAQEVLRKVAQVVDEQGLTVILLEQNIPAALAIAHRACVLRDGRVIQELTATELQDMGPQRWWELF